MQNRRFWTPLAVLISMLSVAAACGDPPKENGGDDAGDQTDPVDTRVGDVDVSPDARGDTDTGPPYDEWCPPTEFPELELETFLSAEQVNDPVHMTQSPGDSDTYYLVQRPGRIMVVQDGQVRDEPFLDIREMVGSGYGEKGLLGLAFHPKYEENGRFFIDYTPKGIQRNIVAEYHRSESDPYKADPEQVQRLVDADAPRKQHNGGTISFGPEGYLHVSLGNGGAMQKRVEDVGRAQLNDQVFGTLLRLDVERPEENFAAPDNPFANESGERDGRILVWGLRNPWRHSFDPKTGDIYIGDVGRQMLEEIDYIPAGSDGGLNFGWPAYQGTMEGPNPDAKQAIDEHTEPIFEYAYKSSETDVRGGCSVIGGEVYRGDEIPELDGYYIYGDLCTHDLGAIKYCDTKDADAEPELVDTVAIRDIRPSSAKGLRSIVADNQNRIYTIAEKHVGRLVRAGN